MKFAFFELPTYVLFVIIFCLIIFFHWLGYKYKRGQLKKFPGQIPEGMGSIEGSILGVMSLLMGFTFSVAISKYEARRQSIVAEANDIGTAILRTDMYPDSIRNVLRQDFKDYVESRISYYNAGNDEERIKKEIEKAEIISAAIWKRVTYYSGQPDFGLRSQQMITILNSMIDSFTTRDALRISKVPPLVLYTLLILVLTAAFLLGSDYKEGKNRNIMLLVGYALVMTLAMNLITELNHPRQGFINLHLVEQKIENLKKLLD